MTTEEERSAQRAEWRKARAERHAEQRRARGRRNRSGGGDMLGSVGPGMVRRAPPLGMCCQEAPHYCPGCQRVMSHREAAEQGACNECGQGWGP